MLIWIIGVVAGCSSARTYSDQVKGVSFNSYKTYAWLPPESTDTTGNEVLDNDITYQNLKAEADKEMARRGFTLNTENPDVLLRLHTNFQERHDIVRSPLYSSYNYYWYPASPTGLWNPYYYGGYYNAPYVTAYDLRQVDYTEGTVTIDMIDRKQGRMVWRGWSDEEISSEKDVKQMYKDVDKIFKKFPVKSEGKK